MKSSAVMGSPFQKSALWRRWYVYVSPSLEISGGPTARSGISINAWSNLYSPENTLRKMSTSAGAQICAGSRSVTSCAMGKLRVWSAASISGGLVAVGVQVPNVNPTASVAASSLPPPSGARWDGALKRRRSRPEDHLASALAARDHG